MSTVSPKVSKVLRWATDSFCAHPRGVAFIRDTVCTTHLIELRVRLSAAEIDAAVGDVGVCFGITRVAFEDVVLKGSLADAVAAIRRDGSVAIVATTSCNTQQLSRGAKAVEMRPGNGRPS